jgi:hypothetical protein
VVLPVTGRGDGEQRGPPGPGLRGDVATHHLELAVPWRRSTMVWMVMWRLTWSALIGST